jgi:hypothetical protein
MSKFLQFLVILVCAAGATILFVSRPLNGAIVNTRNEAQTAMNKGNFKDAYKVFSGLAVNPADDAKQVSEDFNNAIYCLHNLGNIDEIDAFRE